MNRCHAIDCKQQRSERLPMCRRHWLMVPKALKGEALMSREGTAQKLAAIERAVAAVAEREGKRAA